MIFLSKILNFEDKSGINKKSHYYENQDKFEKQSDEIINEKYYTNIKYFLSNIFNL